MAIVVITTGGTIGAAAYYDPIHPPHACTIPLDGRDLVAETIKTAFSSYEARCLSPGLKDSHAIDDLYRQVLVDMLCAIPDKKILITHGTDSMIRTGDYLFAQIRKRPELQDKTIILTGSMMPLANGPNSDGYLNLHYALQLLAADETDALKGLHIVLCDFDKDGYWCPRLYPFWPEKYEKVYAPDGRYNRLRVRAGKT